MSDIDKSGTNTMRDDVNYIASLYAQGDLGQNTLIAVSALLKILVDQAPSAMKVALDYRKCLVDYLKGEAWTLDVAFGVDGQRKGKNQNNYIFGKKNELQIYRDVVSESLESSNDKSFISVGEKYHRSRESIREIYYHVKKMVDHYDDNLLKKMNLPRR